MTRLVVVVCIVLLFSFSAEGEEPFLTLPFKDGYLTQCTQGVFGETSHQEGNLLTQFDLDFDTPNDLDVELVAPVSGYLYFHNDTDGFGNHCNIDLGGGKFVLIAHMKTTLVSSGEYVTRGQIIGIEGCTGFCGGDHVHFGLHEGDPTQNAVFSQSIKAERIWARDQTLGGAFREFTSEEFVGDLVFGHIYEAEQISDPLQDQKFTLSFNYPDFSLVEGLDLYGTAIPDFEVPAIQLTDEIQQQAGSFYYRKPQYVKDGFETTATVWISRNWADGFAFVVLNQYDIVLGGPGGGIGYQNIPGCVAVEFDNWQNKTGDSEFQQDEEPGIHAGVHTMGAVEENSAAPHAAYPDLASGETRNVPPLFDANIHNLKIRYLSEVLSIYIDDMTIPVLEVPISLADVLNLQDGLAWVGFTGATGSATQIQDILSWSFAVNDSALKPDLISEFQVIPVELHVGDIATVNATVRNNSGFDAETSQATVNFGSQSESVAVPALIAGETFSFDVDFGLIAEGPQLVEVIADSSGVINESDEENNTATVEVTVLPALRPDLALEQVIFSSRKKGKNAEVAAEIWISNFGTKDATAFSVIAEVLESGSVYDFRFDGLSVGGRATFNISEFLKKINGVTLKVTIDVWDEIVELDETNNATVSFHAL